MPCEHCCGAEQIFDLARARQELKKYKKKGPRKSTKRLIELLHAEEVKGKSLLDVGAGIGSISWYFLENGGHSITDVDASGAYIETAKSYANEVYSGKKITFIHIDLTESAELLPAFEYVALDKIVCCYPDYKLLLNTALQKCTDTFILSFPMDGLISTWLNKITGLYMYLKRNPFRSYIHPNHEIRKAISDNGFTRIKNDKVYQWHIEMYRKNVNPAC